MKIIIDGNDGVGKSTLVRFLKDLGYQVYDRGIPTTMTDIPEVQVKEDEIYIILDAPVEISQERLLKAGKDLNERFHNLEDLTYYREKFLEVQKKLPNSILIDASVSKEEVLDRSLEFIKKFE